MSSKRGRKRNDNLPPNRARDVQRAFRARRAAHLQALEERVTELEEENDCLRHALNLPPANRLPLGKGPTGKDKPKAYSDVNSQSIQFNSSRGSSTDSPASRTSSLSPSALTLVSLSSRVVPPVEPPSWDDAIVMDPEPPPPSTSPYQLNPMSAPLPARPNQYSVPYSNGTLGSTSSRGDVFLGNGGSYSHSSDRPINTPYGGQDFALRSEIHDESSRQHYSYQPSSYQSHDPNLHTQSPPPAPRPIHPHVPQTSQHPRHHSAHRDSPDPYNRRYLSTDQGYPMNQGYHPLPNSAPIQRSPRPPDFHRQDNMDHSQPPTYGQDGRLNIMP
ncbi:hypothetical protein BDQ17DRAFT_1307622 [Cyathus striatus]|nr:hypothetical protein BDQ17DRAFT_1307622 [Cyathus striatus]